MGENPEVPAPDLSGNGEQPSQGPDEATKHYFASISPGAANPLPTAFVLAIKNLERELGMPVWLLVQSSGNAMLGELDEELFEAFLNCEDPKLPQGREVALLIDSPGGYAYSAYKLAVALRKRCGRFIAVIPRYAKSAATLLTLGAGTIILGTDAELGPLDVQFDDPEREHRISALDEVQSLERLHAFALEAVDRSMFLLVPRTQKKVETILPHVLRFVPDLMRPLFEKIDAVHWTQMSRALKVAEEYAIRLLQPQYTPSKAKEIARHLVENYPEHGFVIDAMEAAKFGLKTASLTEERQRAVDAIIPHLKDLTAIGCLIEVTKQ